MKMIGRIIKFVAIVAGTILLTRTLYATEVGNQILRIIPNDVWNKIYAGFGLEGAETAANAELGLWLFVCLFVSATLVLSLSNLLTRILHRRQHPTRTNAD